MILGISGKIQSGKDLIAEIIQYLTRDIKYVTYSFEEFQSELAIDYTWKVKKFAGKLKDIICILLNCTRKQLEDNDFKKKELGPEWYVYGIKFEIDPKEHELYGRFTTHEEAVQFEKHERRLLQWPSSFKTYIGKQFLTPRKLLQLMGTECGREIIHPNLWVNALMSEYIVTEIGNIPRYGWTNEGDHLCLGMDTILDTPNWLITDVRFPNEAASIKERGGIIIRVNRSNSIKSLKIEHESETSLDDYEDFDYTIENDGTIDDLSEKVKAILISEKLIYERQN